MPKDQIRMFIQKSLREIKGALPEDYRVDDKIHFEIAVVTKAKAKGGLDIKIASLGTGLSSQSIHKLKFSVVDEKAQAKSLQTGKKAIKEYFSQIARLDEKQQPVKKKK